MLYYYSAGDKLERAPFKLPSILANVRRKNLAEYYKSSTRKFSELFSSIDFIVYTIRSLNRDE